MTDWKPRLRREDAPLYQALADAIVEDVASGLLAPGARLPTHRELAGRLGISLGTVTRAYQEAHSRGALDAAPGRGSFVRRLPGQWPLGGATGPAATGLIDLSVAHPLYRSDPDLATALRSMADGVDAQRLLRYQPLREQPRYAAAGHRWLAECGCPMPRGGMQIAAGAQHAGFVLLSVLARPGDLVLTDELTYPGFLSAAELRGVRVRGVPMDREGMDPDALREICRRERPGVLYLVPTLQNPTGILVPGKRREALAEIAETHDWRVIEDDTLRLLVADPPPTITSLIPHRSFFIASMSKAVAGGVRLAFMGVPPTHSDAVEAALGATAFTVSPLLLELGTSWIEDGSALRTVARKRAEIGERHHMAREILGPRASASHPGSYYLWLALRDGWSSAEFEAEARRRGVGVTGSRPFAANPGEAPEGVRVCLSAAEDRDRLAAALRTLELLLGRPATRTPGLL